MVPHAGALVASALGLVALAGAATIYIAVRAGDADRLVAHTVEVRQDATQLLSDLQDAEISQQGFLLTADGKYLGPIHRAQRSVPSTMAELLSLVSNNPEQQNRLNHVKSLVDR